MTHWQTCPRGHTFHPPAGHDPGRGVAVCPQCAAEPAIAAGLADAGLDHLLEIGQAELGAAAIPPALPRFAGFEVLEEVAPGVGGMGVVYKARELSLDRIVALKTLGPRLHNPVGLAYFEREARAAARLEHPNILRIFGFSPEHVPPFYVMQYLEGARGLVQAARGRGPAFIAELLEKTARALEYAHARGVVHRDIKPGNILIGLDDEPYVADFGVAGLLDNAPAAADHKALVGTPPFIAPETYLAGESGPAVDVYALGVTLYLALAGRLPFNGTTLEQVRRAVLESDPPLPREIEAAVPEPLQRICLKAMERDPAARYESAGAMADDLARFGAAREVWARPTRYQAELRGRLRNHLTEIRLWREQTLIDVHDMDRLSRPYNAMLEAISPWLALSKQFPWESVLLRTGGWLVVISSILWPAFYWAQLTRAQRVWAVAAPTAVINLAGWLLRLRGSAVNSLVYLSTGALLLPLLCSVVLTEYQILPHPQPPTRELLATHNGPHGIGAGQDYAPTNLQLTITAGAFVAYCLMLLAATGAPVLGFWLGAGLYAVFSGLLLMAGLKEWMEHEQVARALLLYGSFALLFWPLALGLERVTSARRWAAVLFTFFPLPFALCVSLLAHYGSIEWLHAQPRIDDQTINLWWMLDGLVFLAAGWWAGRSRLSYVRFWAAFLMLLVPLHLLGPPQVLFGAPGHDLFRIGHAMFTTYELAAALLAIALIVLGTRLRQNAMILPALLGLALFFFRATARHFLRDLSWPLAVAIAGALAMAAALASLLWRARRQRERMI